jgi:hypothetical protein
MLVSLPDSLDRPWRLIRGIVPLPQQAPWPRFSPLQAAGAAVTLPVPATDIFQTQEGFSAATQQAAVSLPYHPERIRASAGSGADAIAKLISVHAHASRRMIPGSRPIAQPGLKRGPVTSR